MRQIRKRDMAKSAGRGRPNLPAKEMRASTFSMRVEGDQLAAIDAAAKAAGKTRTRFILNIVAEKMRPDRQRPDIRALADAVAMMVDHLERRAGLQWIEDPFVAQGLAEAVASIVDMFAPAGKEEAPVSVVEVAARMPESVGAQYLTADGWGAIEAITVRAFIESRGTGAGGKPVPGSILAALRRQELQL